MCADVIGTAADFDVIKDDAFGELVRYRANDVWSNEFHAVVDEDREADELGGRGSKQVLTRNGPFYVTVSKTDVPIVRERRDMVRARGLDLTVARIDGETVGSWRLYCVA